MAFSQCCFDVGPPFLTSAQHQNNIGKCLVFHSIDYLRLYLLNSVNVGLIRFRHVAGGDWGREGGKW